jgi:hypothetical protein
MIAAEELREILDYSPETGHFYWRQSQNAVHSGQIAGCMHHSGYRVINIKQRQYQAHRLAWLYVHGFWPPEQIDHINRVKDDNRIANLRLATRSQNMMNRNLRNKAGYRGVHRNSKSTGYNAYIKRNGRSTYLGYFETAEQAYEARLKAERKLFGEFAPQIAA